MALRLPTCPAKGLEEIALKDLVPQIVGGRHRPWWRHLLPRGLTREGVVLEQHIREGRFQRSLALIAGLSSLPSGFEVAYEHYRGSYSQLIMYSPIVLSPLLFLAGVAGTFSRRASRTVLPLISAATIVDGCVGFIFHVRGVQRKPGGWRIPVANVIMGPPVFAPLLFAISGFLGVLAALLRREDDPAWQVASLGPRPHATAAPSLRDPDFGRQSLGRAVPAGHRPAWLHLLPRGISREGITLAQDVREGRFQRSLAAAAAFSAVFSGIEALYSHYKNNFRYPKLQWSPIMLMPLLFAAGIGAVRSRTIARTALPVVSLLAILDGTIGTFYHARGILRRPGGLTMPLYNIMYGPPIFAPMLFAASGFMGLLASLLRRET